MYQYDDSSAVATLPTPAAGGTPGYFTDGNAANGSPATILRSDFMNMLMMELLNVVNAAGVAPSKTSYNQVLTAIKNLLGGNLTTVTSGATALTSSNAGLVLMDASGGNVTVTLPAANAGKVFFKFIRVDTSTNTVTINKSGTDTFLTGVASHTLAAQADSRELLSDGVSKWSSFAVSKGRLLNVQVITVSGTYTPTPGTTSVVVEVQGAGAAGGGVPTTSSSQNAVSGGGGSGAYGVGKFTAAQIGSSQPVTIGQGGVGVANGTGGNGGTSSFGALLSAPGGVGCSAGGAFSNTGSSLTGFGAGGAAPSGANIKSSIGIQGGSGVTTSNGVLSGSGGGSPIYGGGGAAGGTGVTSNPAQNSATVPGAGGSGACYGASASTSAPGGNGAAGIVIVWEYA